MSVLVFLVYLLIVVAGVWAIWRFFLRNPLAEWARERLYEDLGQRRAQTSRRRKWWSTKSSPSSSRKRTTLFDQEGEYVPYEEIPDSTTSSDGRTPSS